MSRFETDPEFTRMVRELRERGWTVETPLSPEETRKIGPWLSERVGNHVSCDQGGVGLCINWGIWEYDKEGWQRFGIAHVSVGATDPTHFGVKRK